MPISEKDVIIRLLISFLSGALIGLERQIRNRHAGMRTNILLCMSSTFLTICGIKFYGLLSGGDISKLVIGVIVSMGFLGAGVIYKEKENGKIIIRGLTTSATLMITAIIGLAIGMGYIFGGIVVTILTLFALVVVRHFEVITKLKKFRGTNI